MRGINPWVLFPVLAATVAGGVIGALVTQVSCAPGSCLAAAVGIGVLSAAAAFAGVGVVMVLALRSVAEWRASEAAGRTPPPDGGEPGPPTC
jgi:hypothetical protein